MITETVSNLLHLFRENKAHDQADRRTLVTEYCPQTCRTFFFETRTEHQSKTVRWREKLEQSSLPQLEQVQMKL